MMQSALDMFLRRFITAGRLVVRWPDGRTQIYSGRPGPEASVMLRDRRTVWRLVLNPKLSLGEAYMDGGLVALGGSIHDVLEVVLANLRTKRKGPLVAWLRRTAVRIWRPINQFNARGRARRNVAHHYDLNGRLYSLFLDRDRQYSCAYFPKGTETLEEAQEAKKHHIAAKLCLERPDLSILDIGCGWGGMALTLARDYGARVTGVTLSTEQLAAAQARADAEGLADRVSFQLLDYRAADQSFDRIVSVGMFEHVGVFHYRTFFDTVSRCLKPDGVALLHSIGQWDGPGINNPWISKYIFPGAYCPALSEVMPAIEDSGLLTTDVEVLRLHYAETLRHWRLRSCLPVLLSLLGADWRVFWLYSNPPRSVATNEPTGFYKSPKHISASHDVVCAMAAASPLHGVGGNVTFTAGRETISKFKRAFVAVPISAA